ncbi:MAG TPA: polysaccharide biosynthesis tyrosine autokinase [Tepidisphaeraceae bacterium]|nr:polysaccharide biosynthesis tyrosine autokinase [Tepidisphaeraceae bacterium]
MTTLPQTTNARLPRPQQGAMQLHQGSGGGMMAPHAGQQAPGQGGNEAWRVIRAHIWMILIVTGILAPSLGVAANWYLGKYHPRFTSEAFIEVRPPIDPGSVKEAKAPIADPAQTALEARTQAQYLKHDSLLTRLLTNPNGEVRKTQWFKQFDQDVRRAKEDFEKNLSVDPITDTKLIRVRFTYSVPDDCKTIVQDLVSTHLEDQKRVETQTLMDRTSMLNNVKIKAETRLKDVGAEMRQRSITLNLEGGGIGRIGVKEMELSKLTGEMIEAQMDLGKAQGGFQAIQGQMQAGQDPANVEMLANQINPNLQNGLFQLKQAEIQLAIFEQQVGKEHQRFKQQLTMVQILKAAYEQEKADATAKARLALLEQAQQAFTAAQGRVEGMSKRIESLKQDLGELSNSLLAYMNLQDEQRGLLQTIKQVRDQIENVMALTAQGQASRVVLYAPPEKPLNRSFPKLWMVMAVAIALGAGLSLGIAFLREAMDQSIKSPRDIARVGQINLLGIVPDESDDPQSAGARLPVVIFDAPHSVLAESFRHVRTKLQHTASLDTTRSIMVTSASPGDGKTTVACNLAAGLALNGRRILLVDANFRRPEIHKVFGLPNGQGFSDVLNAVAAFDEVLRETQVPNLAVMTAGPRPVNPTELFESQLLIDFIERALEEFDHVIFDSGPIMVVAEAQAMAPRVDGVVSVVRAKTNNRGLLQRMREEMRRTKAEHLGVVLNGVRARGGGYYRRSIQTYYDYANNT